MFGALALSALFTALLVQGDATPKFPGPGVIQTEGQTCRIEWDGDTNSTTAWKNMSIQLMTGSNFEMIHLTTVASGLDGTLTGFFTYPCPDVTPQSAIYFYQHTSPLSPNKAWTTRFTIVGADGASVPPANAVQPGSGEAIPWGVGALADPSEATPPPPYLTGDSPTTAGNTTPLPTSTNSTSILAPTTSLSAVSDAECTGTGRGAAGCATSSASPTATPTVNGTGGSGAQSDNAAIGSIVVDRAAWGVILAFVVSALGSAVLP